MTRSKPIAFFAEGQYWVNNHAHCIDATDKFILEYLCFYINAISLEKYVTGSAQPKMTQDNMNSILIPLPPYSEQKRMSQRLNEVMYTVDNIEIGKVAIRELASKAKSLTLPFEDSLCHKIQMMNLLLFCWSVSEQAFLCFPLILPATLPYIFQYPLY